MVNKPKAKELILKRLLLKKLVIFFSASIIIAFKTYASCLDAYNEVIFHQTKRTSGRAIAIPISSAGGGYLGYLSIVNVSNLALASGLSSTTSTTLIGAGAILSSTTVTGEIIRINNLKKVKRVLEQSEIGFGKDLVELHELIKKRNNRPFLTLEKTIYAVNELNTNLSFCPESREIPLPYIKVVNLVEDRIFSPMKNEIKQSEF